MNNSRIEYKYYINTEQYQKILSDILIFCKYDKNSNDENFYEINSIYFENIIMKSYFDRLDGNNNKLKLRLRYYNKNNQYKYFLEFKYKIGDKTKKDKIELSKEDAEYLLKNSELKNPENDIKIDSFQKILSLNGFMPFINVLYKRTALTSKIDNMLRITFDSDIKCSRFNDIYDKSSIYSIPKNKIVMEIKSHANLPFWLVKIVDKHRLKKESISKYMLSVQATSINYSFCIK